MRRKHRVALLRTMLVALVVEVVVLGLTATALAVLSVAARGEGDELAGLGELLLIAAVLCGGLAVLCGMGLAAVRDTMRRGYGALGRAAAVGVIHLWTGLVAVLMHCPAWTVAVAGVPALVYLPCWWLLRERSHRELLMLDAQRR